MSKASLESFLKKLHKELQGSSDPYRRYTANRREQTFVYYPRVLINELEEEFDFRGLKKLFFTENVENFLKTHAYNILTNLRHNAKTTLANRDEVKIISNQHFLKVTLGVEINLQKNKAFDNFDKLKKVYKEEIDSFALSLVDFLEKEYKVTLTKAKKQLDRTTYTQSLYVSDERIERGSDLFEGGHEQGEGILETRMRDALDSAFNTAYKGEMDKEALKSNLELLGIKLDIVRDDSDDSHTFYIQSRVGNQKAGFTSAKDKSEMLKDLKSAIQKLNSNIPIEGLKGSDSILERKAKEVAISTLMPFEKLKGVKVKKPKTPKKTKRSANLSNRQSTKKAKSTLSSVRIKKVPLAKRKRQPGLVNQVAFIKILNDRLPQQLNKNMKFPALENRSGRFLSSVRVVDISKTAKGFPSIGFTYQKEPYQVYETSSGSRFSSHERDPRNLIDKSIREIATELAIGRFYTRRV